MRDLIQKPTVVGVGLTDLPFLRATRALGNAIAYRTFTINFVSHQVREMFHHHH